MAAAGGKKAAAAAGRKAGAPAAAARRPASSAPAPRRQLWLLGGGAAAAAAAVLLLLFSLGGGLGGLGGGPPELRPLRAPRMKDLPEWRDGDAYRSNMLWGSYRSGLYFGMATRSATPLLAGLMWFDPSTADAINRQAVRHEAQQGDALSSYGWVRHDGRSYGRQELVDGDYALTVTMVKRRSDEPGASSAPGGDWAVRVRAALSAQGRARMDALKAAAAAEAARDGGAQPPPKKPPRRQISLMFYVVDADWGAANGRPAAGASPPLQLWPDSVDGESDVPARLGEGGARLVAGSSRDVGGAWELHARPGASAEGRASKHAAAARVRYVGARVDGGEALVALKAALIQALMRTAQRLGFDEGLKLWLPNVAEPHANLAVFQLTMALPGEADFVFVTVPERGGAARLDALSGQRLATLAAEREALFDSRFELTFPTPTGDNAADNADDALPEGVTADELREASKAALSNLLGSMGYFYGASRVQLPSNKPQTPQNPGGAVVDYWPDALFTAVPSRSFFPRGFLWDEGFHQLLVARWDPQLSRDSLSHWLDLMNAQGWIPREQILGAEARARVPAEFVAQHPSHANPPSLFLPLLAHARAAAAAAAAADAGSDEDASGAGAREAAAARAFLARAWPRLEAWYGWFNATQAGREPGTYMWKGRDAATRRELNPKTLMSGLDDYPRASHPTPDERHVDLLCWMALASSAMAEIGAAAGAPPPRVRRYAAAAAALGALPRLVRHHYDAGSGAFADWGLHTEDVELAWVEQQQQQGNGQQPTRELVRRETGAPPTPRFVPAFGYVSLFPLLMQLLPADSPELGEQLALLRRDDLLWTPHGLRSLAPTSSLYKKHNTEHDAPYWRGQVWVNVNYLALRALKHYASAQGPHAAAAAEAYRGLRSALLGNLVRQYRRTGFLWEQYDDDATGKPKGSHPFTGWTALLSLIASEVYA